jgi:hypothetical protein
VVNYFIMMISRGHPNPRKKRCRSPTPSRPYPTNSRGHPKPDDDDMQNDDDDDDDMMIYI